MKKAFTMIELIFVIVILGVLAAVAVPKLAATRNDAVAAGISMSIGVAVSEIVEYAVSKGTTTTDITVMSNSAATLVNTNKANKENAGRKIVVLAPDDTDCVSVEVISDATNDDLNVSFYTTNNLTCQAIQRKVDRVKYSVPIRGVSIPD